MLALSLVLSFASLPGTSSPALSTRGLVELTSRGEVLFLPRHHRQPFDAWLFSRAARGCDDVERTMLDVESWPRHFENIESARAVRDGETVRYELDLTVAFSPTIRGSVTRIGPRTLRFADAATKAYSVYELEDVGDGTCLFRYRVVEEPGKSSGWVAVLKGLEKTSGDAGNFAAALSSSRGFGKPETAPFVARAHAAADAEVALAAAGTVVAIDRSGARPVYTFRRRVAGALSDIVWSIRNKKAYPEKSAVVRSASDRGRTAEYTVGGFGGRVSFRTDVVEGTDAHGVLTVEESVSGGDLKKSDGGWRWRIVPVEGGADVELRFACDIVAGSTVMSTLARTDPIARESFMLHVGLSFIGDLVPGKPLPLQPRTLARE